MVTENEELSGQTDSSFLFESQNIFFVIDIVSIDRMASFLYPETCKRPLIYIPLTAEELAHYD